MVDLKLETVDLERTAKDLYVAVRVGEVQKLTRLAATKNFKFNQAAIGDRKFARVDVFRRVGSTSVSIKNAEASATVEEVCVPLPDHDPLTFKVHLSPESQEKRKTRAEKLSTSETNSKVMEAKHYLLEHNLEDRLSQAMQGVLRDRPKDPGQYIADLLRRTANDYAKLPAPGTSPVAVTPSPVVWSHKPSIGTWLGKPTSPSSARVAPEKAFPAPETISASPYVLGLREEARQVVLKGAQDGSLKKVLQETFAKEASTAGDQSVQSKADALKEEARMTLIKASKEGNLARTLQEALGGARTMNSFAGKPSVGTWLVPRYCKKESASEATAARPLVMLPLQCLYGPGFASTGIQPNFVFR